MSETVRVVSTHPPTQGPYVLIDKDRFDPAVHTLYEPPATAEAAPAEHKPADKPPAGGRRKG